MIYLSKTNINILLYVVKERHNNKKIEYYRIKSKEIEKYIIQGTIIKPRYYVLEIEDSLKEVEVNIFKRHNQFNTTYIYSPEVKYLKDKIINLEYVEDLKINISSIKKDLMSPYRIYFKDEEGFEKFWELFKEKPKVLKGEIIRFYSDIRNNNKFITKEDVEQLEFNILLNKSTKKEVDRFIEYLGNPQGNKFILEVEDNKLFSYIVGTSNYPSLLVKHFTNNNQGALLYALNILNTSILNRGSIKLHALIFQTWLIDIDFINHQDNNYVLKHINTLEKILKGNLYD